MTRKKTGFRCKENREENWLGVEQREPANETGVESVAVSLAELKPQPHRARASHLQLRAASGSKRATKGDERERSRRIGRGKKNDQMGRPLGNAFGIKATVSVCSRSRGHGVNFRHEVSASISGTSAESRQRRNTLREPDADVLQLQQ